jgi:hypothetical protein
MHCACWWAAEPGACTCCQCGDVTGAPILENVPPATIGERVRDALLTAGATIVIAGYLARCVWRVRR